MLNYDERVDFWDTIAPKRNRGVPTLLQLSALAIKPAVLKKDAMNNQASEAKRIRVESKYYEEHLKAHLRDLKNDPKKQDQMMEPKRIRFWDGTENGSFTSGLQMCNPITVKEYGGRWQPIITGVIVIVGNRTRLIDPARLEIHKQVLMDNYIATQQTGFIKFRNTTGAGVALVSWKNEKRFLHPNSFKALPSNTKRQCNAPDRLQPDEKGILQWKPEEVKAPLFTSSDQTAKTIFADNFGAIQDGLFISQDLKVQHKLRCGDIPGAIDEALSLKGVRRNVNTGLPTGRPSEIATRRMYKTVESDPNRKLAFQLEIIYSIVKGQRLRPFCDLTTPTEIANKRKRSNKKYYCPDPTCNKPSQPQYHPYCAEHKKELKKCTLCGEGEARCAGGLCRPCDKKRYPNEEARRQAKLCKHCNCKPSKRIGGFCSDCRDVKKIRRM